MPDYTIEVNTTGGEDYSFDVLDVQPFILADPSAVDWFDLPEDWDSEEDSIHDNDVTHLDPADSEWHFTEVPVYDPPDPEQFRLDMVSRGTDDREVRVLDSSDSLVVEGLVEDVSYVNKIGGEPITEGLFRLVFDEVASGLPDGPTYREPGGLYERITENADQYW